MFSFIRSLLVVSTFSVVASASTISFNTLAGAQNGLGDAVNASGTITTNANGTITVTLNDLLANPANAGQLLSDLFFNISITPTTALNTTTTPTGSLIAIDASGVASASAASIDSWALTSTGTTIHIDSLAGSGPGQTIIGPGGAGGVYTNANNSIAGNGPHNPFLTGTVTFNFAVGGVTAATTISNPVFSFGTVAGDNVNGCIVGAAACNPVPEPITSGLVGTGLVSLFFLRRRFASKA